MNPRRCRLHCIIAGRCILCGWEGSDNICRECWGWRSPLTPMFVANWFHRRKHGHNFVLSDDVTES